MSVQEALTAYIKATNSHSFQNVKELLSDGAVYWFTDKEYKSITEIENYFNNTWNLIKEEVYSVTNVNWIGIDDNIATCLYTYHWEGYYDGNHVSGKGNATNVFKKIDDKWKLIHEHLSPLK